MAKGKRTDQRGRSNGEPQHIRIYSYELASPAYRALSCNARALYVDMLSFYNGGNNGKLFMSVRFAAECMGVSPNTAQNALKMLESHGFIKPHVKGSFSYKARHATTWILTTRQFANNLETKDYMKWKAFKK